MVVNNSHRATILSGLATIVIGVSFHVLDKPISVISRVKYKVRKSNK